MAADGLFPLRVLPWVLLVSCARARMPPSGPSAPADDAAIVDPELTVLEQVGQRIYLREACASCHAEPRLGDESAPSLGNMAGPSLRLIGGKYPVPWHYEHFRAPREVVPGSDMPAYPHLLTNTIDESADAAREQGQALAAKLRDFGVDDAAWDAEVVALIAYLQTIGLEEQEALRREAAAAAAEVVVPRIDPTDPAALAAGEAIFEQNCVPCHGADLRGPIAPDLTAGEWRHGDGGFESIIATTRDGVLEKGMPAWGAILGPEKVEQVSAWLYAQTRTP